MRIQRTEKGVGARDHRSTIEELQRDLSAFNRCIAALEKADASPEDLDVLTAHALALALQIDEALWHRPAEALSWLFERTSPKKTG